MERALYRPSAFVLNEQNAQTVADICRRLDGIPLAIELAAARVGALAVEEISERLSNSLKLLTGGARTAVPRQRTLRGALDWGHDLLTEPEKRFFGRLSVFAGGWTLGAAEAVGSGEGVEEGDVLDLLSRLVDKSLVIAEAGTGDALRYRMLEPVRQYAREKREQREDTIPARRQHALWYTRFAEEAEKELTGPDQSGWLDQLEVEHDNLRTALRWTLEGNEPNVGVRLAAALWRMWYARGYLQEGRGWLKGALSSSEDRPSPERARALNGTAALAWQLGDNEAAKGLVENSLEMGQILGDKRHVSRATNNLANVMRDLGDYTRAGELLEQCLVMDREMGDRSGVAYSLGGLGDTFFDLGDLDKSIEYYEQSLALHRELDDRRSIGLTLHNLGELAQRQDKLEKAGDLYGQSMAVVREIDDKWLTIHVLMSMGSSFAIQSRWERATCLLSAVDGLRREIGFAFQSHALADYERAVERTRTALTAERFEAAWQQGYAMSLEEAVEYATSWEETGLAPAPDGPSIDAQAATLTRREREVAIWIARDLTNKQVAAELGVSTRTVDNHVTRILKKLGLRSRKDITARMDDSSFRSSTA